VYFEINVKYNNDVRMKYKKEHMMKIGIAKYSRELVEVEKRSLEMC
jgi:hypothetical protein